jgi:hypothetical protein
VGETRTRTTTAIATATENDASNGTATTTANGASMRKDKHGLKDPSKTPKVARSFRPWEKNPTASMIGHRRFDKLIGPRNSLGSDRIAGCTGTTIRANAFLPEEPNARLDAARWRTPTT